MTGPIKYLKRVLIHRRQQELLKQFVLALANHAIPFQVHAVRAFCSNPLHNHHTILIEAGSAPGEDNAFVNIQVGWPLSKIHYEVDYARDLEDLFTTRGESEDRSLQVNPAQLQEELDRVMARMDVTWIAHRSGM